MAIRDPIGAIEASIVSWNKRFRSGAHMTSSYPGSAGVKGEAFGGVNARLCKIWSCVLIVWCLCSCAPAAKQTGPVGAVKPAGPDLSSPTLQLASAKIGRSMDNSCGVPALVQLWQQRVDAPLTDFPIGPGDVIDISVPEVDELQNQKVRVSARGQIELPLIGSVEAAGLDENELHDALVQRLKVYMKTPRVELFVENYRSRGVAVMGAVQKPGYYDMADEQQSVESMIGLAGGLSSGAAQKVIFVPVQKWQSVPTSQGLDSFSVTTSGPNTETAHTEAVSGSAAQQAGSSSATNEGQLSSTDALAVHSMVFDLDSPSDAGCLNVPARPGDTVIVPIAGQVMVEGWVQNPGAFAITPGMTVLGAVTAAGGPMFSWWAELIRTDGLGGKTISHYTLSRLESGKESDPPVDSGDVVLVEKTLVGAVPYALYEVFQHFGTGIGLPVF